jgi:hypothetical protein
MSRAPSPHLPVLFDAKARVWNIGRTKPRWHKWLSRALLVPAACLLALGCATSEGLSP